MKLIFVISLSFFTIYSAGQSVENLLDFVSTKNQQQLDIINHTALTYKHGNYKYGINLLKKKMKKRGEFYDGLLFLGYGEKEIESYKNAIEYFNKSIALNPKAPIGYFLRGNVFIDMKNYRLALKDYKKCIKLDSLFYPAYNNLALTKVFNQGEAGAHRNDFKMAKKELGFLLNCDEDKVGIETIYFNLGLVHLNLNEYYEAMCFFRKAEKSEKLKYKAIYYGAVSKFNIKLYSNASSDFKRAQLNNYRSEECGKYLSLIRLITQ